LGISNLIFTPSGIRGIYGKDLTVEIVKKIAIAFGLWLKDRRVIIGRDTRPSSEPLEKAVIEGLLAAECNIITLGICPTPVIIYQKKKLDIAGGLIITGSHNPGEWNALKLISKTFLSQQELDEISEILKDIDLTDYSPIEYPDYRVIKKENVIQEYLEALKLFIKVDKDKNNLKVIIDTGAGVGKYIVPQLLDDLGCQTILINNDLDENNNFPREIEPIGKNLEQLRMTVWKEKADFGIAFDCDGDRLGIVGDDYKWYPEDVGLALITEYSIGQVDDPNVKTRFVTNLASSLMFDVLAKNSKAEVIRTPIGERYLAEKMEELIIENPSDYIIGGEGSCGGVMFPQFNNARDGIFATAKIIEILVSTGEKISTLVSKLPKYYSLREKIDIKGIDVKSIIQEVKKELISEGEDVIQVVNDLRFGLGLEFFVLIHPSGTEHIIRIISEAKRESLARIYCETTTKLVKLVINKLLSKYHLKK